MNNNYTIRRYTAADESAWDSFVENESINGTFLQTRRFLNYHPHGRFNDCSLIIVDRKGHIAAVCPACYIVDQSGKYFVSHMGSTFGGLVINAKNYYAHKVIEIIQQVEMFLKQRGISEIELRITPDLFSVESSALLEYCLFYCGYQCFNELSTYIDFANYKENILSNFEQGKRTNIHNCLKIGTLCRELSGFQEMKNFYELLCLSLLKYHARPVHSLTELYDLKQVYLKQEVGFWGGFIEDQMVAGAMMFYFARTNVAHAQYLCALPELHTLSPMTYIYYAMIQKMKEKGFRKISFGISTEDKGRVLNYGLTRSKEAYGSKHCLNKKFYKCLNNNLEGKNAKL